MSICGFPAFGLIFKNFFVEANVIKLFLLKISAFSFIAALFTILKIWNNLNIHQWMNVIKKMWYINAISSIQLRKQKRKGENPSIWDKMDKL